MYLLEVYLAQSRLQIEQYMLEALEYDESLRVR
jgi:hypothetical protein